MASLSSKRKVFTNRQLQRRDPRAKSPKAAAVTAIEDVASVGPAETVGPDTAGFDDSFYAALKPRFDAAVATDATDVKQVMRALVQQEFDAGGRDAALNMRPYIIKYVGEHGARTGA